MLEPLSGEFPNFSGFLHCTHPAAPLEFILLLGLISLRLYITALPITCLNEQGRHIHNTNPGS